MVALSVPSWLCTAVVMAHAPLCAADFWNALISLQQKLDSSATGRFCGVASNTNMANAWSSEDLQDVAALAGAANVWHYDWRMSTDVRADGVKFVPMIKEPGQTLGQPVASLPPAKVGGVGSCVKGWNEPDNAGQSGHIAALRTHPEAYAKAWMEDMQAAKAKGYTEFVGPAMSRDSCWLDFFLKACEELAGCKEFVTYLSFHHYRPDCAQYKADPGSMGWRDDLSYLLTWYRLMQKYNARGFNIKGLFLDELGCVGGDFVTPAPEAAQLQYLSEFYKGTIVAVKIGDAAVINKIKGTNWIMPQGPDAHTCGQAYKEGMCKAMDGGPTASADAVRAIESLTTVAWFSMAPNTNYLVQPGSRPGMSPVGQAYFSACKQVALHAAASRRLSSGRPFQVTVVSRVCPTGFCQHETKSISLFIGMQQVNLGCKDGVDNRHTFTYDPRSSMSWSGFGVQDNAWYWRGPGAKHWEQNPDNAGMQVLVHPGCAVSTAASIAGGAVPDARKMLEVTGVRRARGGCTIFVERADNPSLCLAGAGAKQCCAPCSVPWFAASPTCCRAKVDAGMSTCLGANGALVAQRRLGFFV